MTSRKDPPKIAVIGSGISGLTCAVALIERGARVTIIDVGDMLPRRQQDSIDRMKWLDPAQWDPDDVALLRRNETVATHAIPKKLAFGSDYIYGAGRRFAPTIGTAADISFTFAKGGFSTVWGAAMLPSADRDTSDWPIKQSDLAPFYERVLQQMPFSAKIDALATEFPLYRSAPASVALNRQMTRLLNHFAQVGDQLAREGILAGMARLAVQALPDSDTPGCNACGLCLTGCPRGAIYSTLPTLERLIASGSLDYIGGTAVNRFDETSRGVTLTLHHPTGGESTKHEFDRVFLGSGPLNTARIVLESLGAFGRSVRMFESQKFLLPMMSWIGNPRVLDELSFALPNGLLVMKMPDRDEFWAQLQITPVNDLVLQRLRLEIGKLPIIIRHLLAPVLGRLMFGWGSLHSQYSSSVDLTLVPSSANEHIALRIDKCENPNFAPAVRGLVAKLARNSLRLRLLPIVPLMKFSEPGTGNHYGGTFPMRKSQKLGRFETDLIGRLQGLSRVHIVDSSVLPSIPGTTIAFPTMANAMRIATQAPLD